MRYLWAVALLLFAACDSAAPTGVPDLPSALTGTWSLTDNRHQLYLTSNVLQTTPDEGRPGTGSVDVSGAVTARLVYALLADYDGGRPRQVFLTSYDPFTARLPMDGYKLTLYSYGNSGYNGYLDVYSTTGDGAHYEQQFDAPPFAVDGPRVTVAPISFSESGQTVSAAGTLTLAMTTLVPGVRTLVQNIPTMGSEPLSVQYAFQPDGTYRFESVTENNTFSSAGTWRTDANALILRARGSEAPDTLAYEVGPGATLRLRQSRAPLCHRDARCLAIRAQEFGLIPNSLTDYDASYLSTYARSD